MALGICGFWLKNGVTSGGKVHCHVGDERCLWAGQDEFDGVIVDLFDRGNQIGHRHAVKIFPCAAGNTVVGVVVQTLTLKAEDHVVCVEVTGWREHVVGMELHALAQVERVFQTVGGCFPAFSQTGDNLGGACLKLCQPVIDRVRRRIERGAGGVKRGVEPFGGPFGTIEQRLCCQCRLRKRRQQLARCCCSFQGT